MQKTTALPQRSCPERRGKIPQQSKLWYFMRVGACVFLSVLLSTGLLVASPGWGQQISEKKITIELKNVNLRNALNKISKLSGFRVAYAVDVVSPYNNVTLSPSKERTVEQALQGVLTGTPLTYAQHGNTIVVYERPAAFVTAPAGEGPATLVQADTSFVFKGRVTDGKTNEPIVGATIQIKGRKQGTSSDKDGRFEIVLSKATKLEISSIGYESQVITADREAAITVELTTTSASMNEVVVTGMFTRSRQNFTGASSSFTAQDLAKVSNNNLLTTLSVLDPSFRITENINVGSDPNAVPDLVLRGGNSLVGAGATDDNLFNYANNPNVPLFILDGFETSLQRIKDLDMNRVVKVDILKDAAATAIYGSRAANGVIVVETLRPSAGQLRLTYTGNLEMETPDLSGYNLLDAKDKLALEQAAGVFTFYDWAYREDELAYYYNDRLAAVKRGVNTDWIAQPLRTGVGHKHNLYLEGGTDQVLYGVNMTFDQKAGVMKGSDRNVITGNSFLSYRVKNFQFRNDLTLTFGKSNNSPYGSFEQYTRLNPYWTPYDSLGNMKFYLEDVRNENGARLTYFDSYDNLNSLSYVTPTGRPTNPLYNVGLHTIDQAKYTNIANNFAFQWQATNWLRINSTLAYQRQNDESDYFLPGQAVQFAATPTFEKGIYTKGNGFRSSIEEMLTANISQQWGKHQLFGTLGWNIRQEKYNVYQFSVQGFPNASMDNLLLGYQFPEGSSPTGSESTTRLYGLLSQVSYNYDNRFLVDMSFRNDGSSQFGSNNRNAPFWSVGGGWNLHNEKFFAGLSFLNRFKIRYSFGYTGSQNFSSYLGITTTQYYTDREYRGIVSSYLLGYGNNNLKWQKTQKQNFGTDITLFNRLNITANYYIENTQGSVATISTAPSTGFGSYAANMGNVQSKGWELYTNLNLFSRNRGRDNWSVFANLTHVKSVITEVSKEIEAMNKLADESYSSTPIQRYAEGQSTSAIWAVQSKGIDPASGMEILVNRNGDLVTGYDPRDKVIVGDTRPKLEGTFGTNFELHGIGMNLYFRYRVGGDAFNQTLIDRVENVDVSLYNTDRRVLEDRWMEPGDRTFFKGLLTVDGYANDDLTYATSRFVQKDDLLSLENVSVYYRLNDALNNKLHLRNTKLTFFTSDVFRFSSIKRERGLNYPYSHTYTLQLTTSF